MSIRVRILGGFFSLLFLTICVAGIAWRSLSGFATGVGTATTAQLLSGASSRLALAANKAIAQGTADKDPEVRDQLTRVRGLIVDLAQSSSDPSIAQATASMKGALESFGAGLLDLGKQQQTKLQLQRSHRELVEEFQTIVGEIGNAQRDALGEALKSVEKGLAEQVSFVSLNAVQSHIVRSAYELRLLENKVAFDPEPYGKAERLINMITMLVKRTSENPALKESTTKSAEAAAKYKAGLEAVKSNPEDTAALVELGQSLVTAIQGIDRDMLNLQSGIQSRLSQARDRMSTGTQLLALSATAIVAARTAQAEEMELIRSGNEAAAKAMDKAAESLYETSRTIYYAVDQESTNEVIKTLLTKVESYRASIPGIVQANAVEANVRRALAENVQSVSATGEEIGKREIAAINDGYQQALWLLGTGIALSIALGLGLALLVGRSITRPVVALVDAMRRLAAGDHTIETPTHRRDELGQMAAAVQTFKEAAIEKLRIEAQAAEQQRMAEAERARSEAARAAAAEEQALVVDSLASGLERLSRGDLTSRLEQAFAADYEKLRADFNAALAQLQSTMQNIAGSTSGLRSGSGEISHAADDLSRRTEQQAASLEETAAALDEITATVRKTAEAANHASGVVSVARKDAEHSGEVVRDAIAAMGQIEQSSAQISQIIGVIDEIAFQTNLLALNAGVEAARAGDAGKGFAVVAQEVRALAQRSAEAAKEIKTLISASSTQVASGVGLVGETGKALERIVKHVSEISGIVSEITASAQEQSTGLAEVNNAVNQMDQVTQQNAAMVEQSTAASHALARESDELSELVGQFKLGDAARPGHAANDAKRPVPSRPAPPRRPATLRAGNTVLKLQAAAEESWEEF